MHQQVRHALAQSDYGEAEHWLRQLQAAKPNDASVLASLGQSLCWQGRRREGLGYLVKAARQLERQALKSRAPQLAVELSGQLVHWGEIQVAERLARMAVALSPDSPFALNNLAVCLSRVSRYAEALPVSRRVCKMLPDDPGCNILLAIIEFRSGLLDDARSRLNRVIEQNREPAQTARAWLEAGVIFDKLGRYEEAFEAFSHTAEINAALIPPSSAMSGQLFEALRRNSSGFNEKLLKRWPASAVAEDGLPAPAFLLGFLRSGTTLTEQVLGAHPRLLTTDECGIVHELTLELERISGKSGDHAAALETLDLAQLRHLRNFYWKRMGEEYGEEAMVKQLVDKNALNTMELGVISVVFPEAKILFALRDPRDVCLSCFMQAFSPSPATVNLLTWEGIARQYAAVMEHWLGLRSHIQPSYLEIRYEDTVGDFEPTYRRVYEFLGVEWHPEATRFHERAKGRYIATPSFSAVTQPLYGTAVARWKHYERHFVPILPKLEPFIEAFGYPQ